MNVYYIKTGDGIYAGRNSPKLATERELRYGRSILDCVRVETE